MIKIAMLSLILMVSACAPKIVERSKKPLFEVLTAQTTGGGNIQFYEILTEEREIKMLQGDENLKNKVKTGDTTASNFVILNMGEKSSGGYSITIDKVEETPENIIVYVKENAPNGIATSVMTNPYTIIKINSKKPIIFK
jgi:hypothetical protein